MSKFLSSFGIALLFIATSHIASATPNVQIQCAAGPAGGFPYHYCVHQVPGSTSTDVIYYFHGIGGSEKEWQYLPGFSTTYQVWGPTAPTVISISYGTAWLLATHNSSPYSGMYEHLSQAVLPFLETTFNLHPARRMLMGLSMGGFNASQLYLKNPELFSKVVLACPAITSVGPNDSAAEIAAYQQRTGALSQNIQTAMQLSRTFFPTQADWNGVSIVSQANLVVNATYPPLYVSEGLQDEYGFQEGSKALVDAVTAKGAKATWVPLTGHHCTFDIEGSALFFLGN
jgi:pimeloyl-ACP methyl ester carboxylesterase